MKEVKLGCDLTISWFLWVVGSQEQADKDLTRYHKGHSD